MNFKHLVTTLAAGSLLQIPAQGQTCETLLNLTFDPWTEAGNIAAHSSIENVLDWTNGSEVYIDPLFGPVGLAPNSDFSNGYAGLVNDAGQFSYKWGFEGGFDVIGTTPWELCSISFDYDVLGHNGEASLALTVGSWTGLAPLPSTGNDNLPVDPVFESVSQGERATGVVTFDFAANLLTVTRNGYADHTVVLNDSPTLASGTHLIDILVSNTGPVGGGFFDANFNATAGDDAFYRVDNFRITAIPEPSTAGLLLLAGAFLTRRIRR